jgi:error-prone DNA polymerase
MVGAPRPQGGRRGIAATARTVTRAEAAARVEQELALIRRHKLAGFFLLHRDLLDLAREVAAEIRGPDGAQTLGNLPPGRGRGSSVSSVVCYLIGLSPVDPLARGLSLGRFLNEDLPSVPDIDLDFPREIREKLIERIHAVHGPDKAALICAFATYRLRSAVRDVGKALGLPAADLDRIVRLSEPRSARELGAELARLPEYAARLHAPPWCHLVELAGQLAGFPRHVTQHVGGMVVSSDPLTACVPLQPAAMPGRTLCQWDKDSCDDAGFVKIDFLALGMLSLVEECLGLIGEATPGQPPIDLTRIDFTDRRVYDMIGRGDTIGVFQIESRAQIQMLLRTRPEELDDLVVQVAIVRPGPILGGAVTPYILRREQPGYHPTYDHPSLEPVLKETLGVILYQEQVVDVAMALAKFTAGQADQLRRAMTRKRSREAMEQLWRQFRDGAAGNGVDLGTAQAVFRKLMGFAEYGFPKSHAASFAVLAYQSCWLKRYHPAEFTCALLNNQPMGFYPPHVLTNDAKRHGLRILPPDVNASATRCTVEGGNGLRIGLGYLRGLGEEAARRVEAERSAHGPYRSLADLVRRVPLRPEAAESLVAVGAFDGFGLGRREALWQLGLFIPSRGFGQNRKRGAQQDGATGEGRDAGRQLPLALPIAQDMAGVALPPMPAWDQMAADYAGIGLSPRYHPLGLLRSRLPPGAYATTADLATSADGLLVRVAGLVVCRQRPGTAKGITFLLVEDEHGLINAVVYPDLYEAERPLVRSEPFIVVEGRLQRRDRTVNLLAHRLRRLDGAYAAVTEATRTIDQSTPDPGVPAVGGVLDVEGGESGATARLRMLTPASHNYR